MDRWGTGLRCVNHYGHHEGAAACSHHALRGGCKQARHKAAARSRRPRCRKAGSQHPACLERQQVLAAALVAVQVGGASAQAQPQRVKAGLLHARCAELCENGAVGARIGKRRRMGEVVLRIERLKVACLWS